MLRQGGFLPWPLPQGVTGKSQECARVNHLNNGLYLDFLIMKEEFYTVPLLEGGFDKDSSTPISGSEIPVFPRRALGAPPSLTQLDEVASTQATLRSLPGLWGASDTAPTVRAPAARPSKPCAGSWSRERGSRPAGRVDPQKLFPRTQIQYGSLGRMELSPLRR